MAFPRHVFFVLLALVLCAGPGRAFGTTKEQQAYQAAVTAFHDGLWNVAEMDLAQFIATYPDAPEVREAWLLEAQAIFRQGRYAQAEALLTAHEALAGSLADAYAYWIGEAEFQIGHFPAAAARLRSLPPTSTYALPGAVEAAAALARLQAWPALISFLSGQAEVFHRAELGDANNALVLRGRLLLAQAYFARENFTAAGALLAAFRPHQLPPDLEWQRLFLLCQVRRQGGDPAAALVLATNLLEIARAAPAADGGTNVAASVALQASVLEDLGRGAEAIQAFRENLATNAPEDRQREAILKIAALSLAAQEFTNAEAVLENYAAQFTNAPAADAAALALGELYLHDYADQPGRTNVLAEARARFDQVLTAFTNSSFAGQAFLDRGWCGWLAGDYPGALADFQHAGQKLPPSEDAVVARFKAGDALFSMGDYAKALKEYQGVLARLAVFPKADSLLGERALYQSVRAQLNLGDLAGAATNMGRIAAAYPAGETGGTSVLLLGEGYTDMRQPANALQLFQKFEGQAPHSPLRPLVELATARAYEEERNWPAAIAQYDRWLAAYPTNALAPQALYSQAWAHYQAGDETNALNLFTNFVARFPLDPLAPQAQMWAADHYFRQGDSVNAELNYKYVFQNPNWQNSAAYTNALYYPAQMMAGRAAVSRTDNAEAIRDYFQKLENDTNCPLDLRVQAAFAHGSALMKMDSPDTNNPGANYQAAIGVFSQICAIFPTNEPGARAWGEIGDCALQLSRYDDATNAYWQVINSPQASLALRGQARVGLGVVLEKKAGLLPAGPDQTALYTEALADYLDVFQGTDRNEDEPDQDPFWTKKAGLKAADLVTALGQWQQATNIYDRLGSLMPELKGLLARKVETATQHLNAPAR